jgi:hypothetical protein
VRTKHLCAVRDGPDLEASVLELGHALDQPLARRKLRQLARDTLHGLVGDDRPFGLGKMLTRDEDGAGQGGGENAGDRGVGAVERDAIEIAHAPAIPGQGDVLGRNAGSLECGTPFSVDVRSEGLSAGFSSARKRAEGAYLEREQGADHVKGGNALGRHDDGFAARAGTASVEARIVAEAGEMVRLTADRIQTSSESYQFDVGAQTMCNRPC